MHHHIPSALSQLRRRRLPAQRGAPPQDKAERGDRPGSGGASPLPCPAPPGPARPRRLPRGPTGRTALPPQAPAPSAPRGHRRGVPGAFPGPGPAGTSRPPPSAPSCPPSLSYLRAARGAAGPGRAWRRAGRGEREGGKEGREEGPRPVICGLPRQPPWRGSPCGRQEPRRCGPAPSGRRLPPAATAHRAPGTHRAPPPASRPVRPGPLPAGREPGGNGCGGDCVCAPCSVPCRAVIPAGHSIPERLGVGKGLLKCWSPGHLFG